MKRLLCLALCSVYFFSSFTALATMLEVGEGIEIDYNVMIETDTNDNDQNDQRAYYKDGNLVLTHHDTDEDGAYDLWWGYEEMELAMEARDTDADGNADEFTWYEKNGDTHTSNGTTRQIPNLSTKGSPLKNSFFWISLLGVLFLAGAGILSTRR